MFVFIHTLRSYRAFNHFGIPPFCLLGHGSAGHNESKQKTTVKDALIETSFTVAYLSACLRQSFLATAF
jgi:hypothetical protein